MKLFRVMLTAGAALITGALAWRYAARRWRLPCPSALGWVLESGVREWAAPTARVLERMGLRQGMHVLEVGPGVGYMTVPAARVLGESGRLVALELQPAMARRARERVAWASVTNVEVREGDVTTAPLEPATYDLAFLVTVLGEIPDRDRAIARLRDALKPGGVLSFTEVFGDPHYQRYADLARRCHAAGLEPAGRHGSWRSYTANFQRRHRDRPTPAGPVGLFDGLGGAVVGERPVSMCPTRTHWPPLWFSIAATARPQSRPEPERRMLQARYTPSTAAIKNPAVNTTPPH